MKRPPIQVVFYFSLDSQGNYLGQLYLLAVDKFDMMFSKILAILNLN